MAQQNYDLTDILNVPIWEPVQDQLARITGTAIITINYRGTPITKHSCRTEFCSVIRENPISRKRCFKCDSLAGLEAVRLNRPFIYLCHCGIVDVACPVTVDDKYLGAVMFGQVRLTDGDAGKVERLVSEISSFEPDSEQARTDLLELYNKLPEMEYERIEAVADMIASIVQYSVQLAVNDKTKELTYEWMLRSMKNAAGDSGDLRGIAHLEGLPRAEQEPLPLPPAAVSRNSPVYPAVAYIDNHPKQMTSMKEMSDLCKLSSSHFSRLFLRDVGENFKDYLNRRKVELAKQMLANSDVNVSQIAYELGFLDPSYFVKVFKRYEGITPLIYRQHKYR